MNQHETASQTNSGRRAVSAEGEAAGELPVFEPQGGPLGAHMEADARLPRKGF